jgi:hypothetical protein
MMMHGGDPMVCRGRKEARLFDHRSGHRINIREQRSAGRQQQRLSGAGRVPAGTALEAPPPVPPSAPSLHPVLLRRHISKLNQETEINQEEKKINHGERMNSSAASD